jgi:hypothetical protein
MKHRKDLGFSEIVANRPIPKLFIQQIRQAYKLNKKIFGCAPKKKIKIVLCHTEDEYKHASKPYYLPYSGATPFLDGRIATKSQKFLKMSQKKYQQLVINHEMTHVFYYLRTKSYDPLWFQEGLASLVGGYTITKKRFKQMVARGQVSSRILQYRYLSRNFTDKQAVTTAYFVWQTFLEYISKGKISIVVDFLKAFSENPCKRHYQMLFKRKFGKSEQCLFKDFLQDVKNLKFTTKSTTQIATHFLK